MKILLLLLGLAWTQPIDDQEQNSMNDCGETAKWDDFTQQCVEKNEDDFDNEADDEEGTEPNCGDLKWNGSQCVAIDCQEGESWDEDLEECVKECPFG